MLKNASILFSIITLLFFISCAKDDPVSAESVSLDGQWSAGEYTYSIDCAGTEQTFDEYITDLVTLIQIEETEAAVAILCAGYDIVNETEGYCDTPSSNDQYNTIENEWYADQWEETLENWNDEPLLEETVRSENTFSADKSNIVLNINSDKTYSMTYDPMCLGYDELDDADCSILIAAEWADEFCENLTEDGCVSSVVENGVWDTGTSGSLTYIEDTEGEIGTYNIDAVDASSEFDGKALEFDGSSIYIELVTYQQVSPSSLDHTVCIDLSFTKSQ